MTPGLLLASDRAAAPRTLVDVLRATTVAHPDASALEDADGALSYRELMARVIRTAAQLQAAGVRRGDRVGIRLASGSRELYIAILGVLAAGAAYVPVDADDPQERADLVFGEARVRGVIGGSGAYFPSTDAAGAPGGEGAGFRDASSLRSGAPQPAAGALRSGAPQPAAGGEGAGFRDASSLRSGAPQPAAGALRSGAPQPAAGVLRSGAPQPAAGGGEGGALFAGDAPHPSSAALPIVAPPTVDDDAWIIFTSGSTGVPKGVAVTHRSAAAFVDAEASLFLRDEPLGPGDRVLAGLSVAFDASCEEMWLAWRHGACLVPAPRALVRSGMDLGPWLTARGITAVSTVPTLAALWPAESLENVRLLIFGGEACPPELAERLAVDGREVWNTYGPTEATVVACAALLGGGGPVRIGLPLDGWDLAVVGADGTPVAEGGVGELVIGGVGLARYLDPAKDAEKYAPHPQLGWDRAYRSGDLVRFESAGLVFQGRADDQVKVGGRRIELGEIEAAIQGLPGVAGAAVAVRETDAGNRVLVGYLSSTDPAFSTTDALARLRGELPAALVPLLHLMAELPTRTSGKVDKAALPWPLPGVEADDSGLAADRRALADRWQAVLGVPVSDESANFFDLGGGSLAAAQLLAALREDDPELTVADIYAHPRLGAMADALAERAAEREGDPAAGRDDYHRVTPTPRRMQVLQSVLGVPLYILGGVRWLVFALLVTTILGGIGGFELLPRVNGWGLAAACLVFCTPFGRMAIAVVACRLLLAGVRAGDHPRGGSVHLRLWLAEQAAHQVGAVGLAGAPWITYYARALGARIGDDVDLHTLPPVTGMLEIGEGASIEPEVDLAGHWIDGDIVRVGAIRIGAHSTVGARSTLLAGTRIGKRAEIAPGSSVFGRVPSGQRWAGSPAQRVGTASGWWPADRPARGRRWLLAFGASSTVLALLPIVALAAGGAVTAGFVRGASTVGELVARAAIGLVPGVFVAGVVFAASVVLLVRLLAIGLTEGVHAVRGRVGWQVWSTERLLDAARDVLFPLYSSLFTPVWLRLLGARVGRTVEASTVLLLPAMTTIRDGAFLADDTMVASYELGGGWLRIARVEIGKRAFIGNSGMAPAGHRVPKDGLVAVLSAAPRRAKPGSSWLGSPAMRLRRAVAEGEDVERTYRPSPSLRVARTLWELCRFVPVVVTCAIGVAVLLVLAALATVHVGLAVAVSGVVMLAAGAVSAAVSTAAKWLLVGRIRATEYPLWSSYVWRTEVADTFVEMVAAPWFARAAAGTPALVWWLRSLGSRIGRGVWCDSYWLPEADLVTLGDGATVNRGCVVQTHLFHDRILSMDTVTLDPGSTLGPHSVVLPASRIGAHGTVGPASLVMRGEVVPVGSRWSGNPIGPWREVHTREYRAKRRA
ncbi:AMP-binding protein [Galbitalea sp. SE-J8]|uniref:Pls/PosA family non-ribosomal peptide synthetase n=1 Tax=Galbitalea sp. SE-J8 TaxID=3054952 RepID=UPI00259D2EDE|nr:Pls/PosA family non-ribosomal peptide synthetase [Galbitalea sp. SE-J8]MDM4762150.1 AMP-binding protein [Galbitalea sp. SE-J8]